MARVKLLEKEDVDPMVKQIYQKIEDSGSEVINLLKALAHSPKIFTHDDTMVPWLCCSGTPLGGA